MLVPSPLHLFNKVFVPRVKRRFLAHPAKGLGVLAVSNLAQREDIPEAVELAMLPEQVLAAKHTRRKVPYSHRDEVNPLAGRIGVPSPFP